MTNNLNDIIFYNPILTSVFVTWFIAQGLKFIIEASRGNISFYNFIRTGGMPSGHSAVVSSLACAIGLFEGFDSPLFGLSMAVAIIIMHDAVVIRGAAGRQAKALNILAKDLHKDKDPVFGHFKTHLGHTPIQVAVGALLGIAVSLSIWMKFYV